MRNKVSLLLFILFFGEKTAHHLHSGATDIVIGREYFKWNSDGLEF